MKERIRSIQHYIASKEHDGIVYKALLVLVYKFCFILNGGYPEVKAMILELIRKNVSEEKYRNKKFVRKTLNDIIYCRCNYGIRFAEYYIYNFPVLSHEGRKRFVGFTERAHFLFKVNNKSYMEYFNVKSEAYRKFGKYYNRDLITLYGEEDFGTFSEFIKSHSGFIRKPVDDHGGRGIRIFDASEYESAETLFRDVMDMGVCVVEELIVQGEALARIHPQSVNTVRIVTFRESAEKLIVAWCYLRMGMGGSNVDNMDSGGLACMIDPETGVIYATGRDYLNNLHIYHPDTGVQLVGFQLPEWDKLMELLHEVANVLPEVRLVGWDFAYSNKGWSFVEGNSRPGFVGPQLSELSGKMELIKSLERIYDEQQRKETSNE